MGLQFIFGGSGYGKSETINREILEDAKANPHRKYFVVVPDQFTMQTQKDLCQMSPDHGIMNIDVLSFKRLSYRVLEETGKSMIPVLDDTGKSLLLQRVAKKRKDELGAIGGNIKKTGYIHEIKSVISEFMQYSLTPEDVKKMMHELPKDSALQYKLKDIHLLYQDFVKDIEETFVTKEEELVLVKEQIKDSELMRDAVLVFDGFTGFTPVQNRLIQELMKYAKTVYVTILLDERRDPLKTFYEQDLFYLSLKMAKTLRQEAVDEGIPVLPDRILRGKATPDIPFSHSYRYEKKPELAFLERHLFRYDALAYEAETTSLQITESVSPLDEIRYTCEEISRLIQQESYRYQDLAVVTGDLNGYAHFVEEQFEKYEIPFYLDLTRGIVMNPMIEYIKSALALLTDGYTYENVFHFMRSGMLDIPVENIDLLENYVFALGIRGIRKWEEPFYRLSPDFGKDYEEDLKSINEARKIFMERMLPLHQRTKTVEDKVRLLYQFLVDSDMENRLFDRADRLESQGKQTLAEEYLAIYRKVMDLLNQIYELLADEEMGWEDFAEIILAGFEEIQVATLPQNRDAVVVGDIKRTRLKNTKVLFFIGVNDGIIPQAGGSGGILSEIDRNMIEKASYELAPTPRQQMYQQRMYLYMNVTKPTEKLYISYAKVDAEGKPIRSSYFVGVVNDLFPQIRFVYTKSLDYKDRLFAKTDGTRHFIHSLRDYVNTGKESMYSVQEMVSLHQFLEKDQTNNLKQLVNTAFFQYRPVPLSKEVAQALYGRILENSVSRLEKYAGCAYAHFLQYGLRLAKRAEYLLEAKDTGTVIHDVMEEFSKKISDTKYSWFDFPAEMGEELVEQIMDQVSNAYGEHVFFDTKRNSYQIERMKRLLKKSVLNMQKQLNDGLFLPSEYEVSFSKYQDLEALTVVLSDEEKMHLNGRIDRVDLYENDEHVYVKVIDYKSGNRTFSPLEVYHGLQLQLVLYMNVATEREKRRHPGKEIVPSGMFYFQIKDPMIKTDGNKISEEEILQQVRKEMRMEGIANSREDSLQAIDHTLNKNSDVIKLSYKKDGSIAANSKVMDDEDLKFMSKYVDSKIRKMGQEILNGEISINPYTMDQNSACTFCEYQSICKIDSRLPGYQKRELEILSEQEIFEKMREIEEGGKE